jgi:hypothetical protein
MDLILIDGSNTYNHIIQIISPYHDQELLPAFNVSQFESINQQNSYIVSYQSH